MRLKALLQKSHNYSKTDDGRANGYAGLFALSIIILLLSITSCTTFEKCQAKYGTGVDSVKVLVPVLQKVPGSNTGLGFNQSLLDAMPVGSSVSSQPNGESKTTATLTKTGEKQFECKAETHPFLIRDTVEVDCPPVTSFRPDPVIIRETPFRNKLLIWILVGGLALQSLRVWLRYESLPKVKETGIIHSVRNYLRRKFGITIFLAPDNPPVKQRPSIPTQQDNGLPS